MGVFLILFLLAAVLYEKYTLDKGLAGVTFDYAPNTLLLEPDEEFEISTVIENRTRRFFPFIRVREEVPAEIRVDSGGLTGGINGHSARLAHTVYVLPRQRLTRRTKASLPARGRYVFGGMLVYGGDFLGVSGKHEQVDLFREAVVMPKESGMPALDAMLGGFLGDVSVTRFLYEDPVLTLGFREYTGREPQKAISWTQTARTGSLLVKQYDHTLEPNVTVILSCAGALDMEDGEARMEECCSITRSVCRYLEDKHVQYGFLSNCVTAGMRPGWNDMNEGLGANHLRTILEGLGRATGGSRKGLSSLIGDAWKKAEAGRSHILIAPQTEAELLPFARRLEARTGGRVLILCPSKKEASA